MTVGVQGTEPGTASGSLYAMPVVFLFMVLLPELASGPLKILLRAEIGGLMRDVFAHGGSHTVGGFQAGGPSPCHSIVV